MSKVDNPYPLRFVPVDSVGEAPGVEGSFRRARNQVTHTKTAQQIFQRVSIRFWLNNSWRCLVAGQIWDGKFRNHCGRSTVSLPEARRSTERSLRKGKLWMNAFIAGQVVAIRAWWRRNFQSARNVATAGVTGRNGNSSSHFSAAGYFSMPAPTIRPTTTAARTVITATATDTAASKQKPSIVRVIRFRRPHRAYNVARVATTSGGL
jgi:hypothetical protein